MNSVSAAATVSVVIPTYHREAQLLEAVASALGQAGVDLEVIVVDDSAEGTARAPLAAIDDARLRYVHRSTPSGGRPARVRNDGARIAGGRFLHFLDDDDLLESGALARLVQALETPPAAGMAFGAIVPFGPDAKDLHHHEQYFARARRIAQRLRGPGRLSACLMFRPAILVNSACMARREAFEAAGGFDPDIAVCEDADLWGRIAQASGYRFVDSPVVRYRTGAPSLMHDLSEDDARLHASYRHMQDKYRRAHGRWNYLHMKLWARFGM
jgi:GT2 family glycosyltransferase